MKLRPINKKAQIDFPIVTFAIVVIGLLFLGPILLKLVRTTVTPFGDALNQTSIGGGSEGASRTLYILGIFVNFWDAVLLFAFMLAVVMLFISALFIDTNPFFIILYVVVLLLVVIFSPNVLGAINNIYDSSQFVEETALLGFMDFIRLNFGVVLTVIGILTMIVIYAKVRFFPSR